MVTFTRVQDGQRKVPIPTDITKNLWALVSSEISKVSGQNLKYTKYLTIQNDGELIKRNQKNGLQVN